MANLHQGANMDLQAQPNFITPPQQKMTGSTSPENLWTNLSFLFILVKQVKKSKLTAFFLRHLSRTRRSFGYLDRLGLKCPASAYVTALSVAVIIIKIGF